MNVIPIRLQGIIVYAYNKGYSLRQIELITGCSRVTIRRYIKSSPQIDNYLRRLNICKKIPKTKLERYCKEKMLLKTLKDTHKVTML